ncbi:MAG TPA: hypothetical protein EYH36_05425 [Desulfocapsa sulfexigens]|nr:hypothetical protein [Desulfocapsa sulfexigens]
MDYKEIISSCYCGDGGEKLKKAEALVKAFGRGLSLDAGIQKQLLVVQDAVLALDTHMTAMEMGKTCTTCAATSKGGCCSAYMGHENNDALLLLMNLLAGVDVKLVRDDAIECCFLAETGCILLFKPIFCLNYLCSRIQTESSEKQLSLLEQKSGALLTAQGQLEQSIIVFLQSQGEMLEE